MGDILCVWSNFQQICPLLMGGGVLASTLFRRTYETNSMNKRFAKKHILQKLHSNFFCFAPST